MSCIQLSPPPFTKENRDDFPKRDATSDVISGVCIIHMIFGHSCLFCGMLDNSIWRYSNYLLFCYMPWFFFKSGMFHKDVSIKDAVGKYLKRLLIPYFCFSVIGYIMETLPYLYAGNLSFEKVAVDIHNVILRQSIEGNNALWFLLTLFIANMFIVFANSKKINHVAIILILFSVSSATPYLIEKENIWQYTWDNILPSMFYLFVGHELFSKKLLGNKWVILLSLITCLAIFTYCDSYVEIYPNRLIRGVYMLWLLKSTSMIVILYNLFSMIATWRYIRPVVVIGQQTMAPYVMHWPILVAVKILGVTFHMDASLQLILSLACCILFVPVLTFMIRRCGMAVIIGE